jgi:transcriptional regulator with XRE-family HTH domain
MTSPRSELIKRRKALGFNQKTLAIEVNAQVKTVARWEQGKSYPRPVYLQPLARALRVDLPELDRLLNPGAPPVLKGHRVPRWLSHYESLVEEAGHLAQLELLVVPALLQTETYSARLERLGPLALSDEEVSERVRRRMARQAVLSRKPNPLTLLATVSESALRKKVGGEKIMFEQLGHLIEMSQLPNVEVRVVPADGRDACAMSGFELLTKADEVESFMAVVFDIGGIRYIEDTYLLERYSTMFEYLERVALHAEPSLELIETIQEGYR